MSGSSNSSAASSQATHITVNIDFARLKRRLYSAALILLLLSVIVYVIFRDQVWMDTHQLNTPPAVVEQTSLLHKTMFTGRGTSGESFTVTTPKNFHLTIRGLKGSHIVINKWKGSVVYSSKQNNKNGPDFDDEVFLDPGDYVVSLVAKGEMPAQTFIELR